MAWELEIHHIDVGQGESTLVIAMDTTNNAYSTMLIDCGLQDKAQRISDYAWDKLPTNHKKIDRIVTTHWDEDHSYGMTAFLIADNLNEFIRLITDIADKAFANADQQDPNMPAWKKQLWIAAEVAAACLGAYESSNTHTKARKDCATTIVSTTRNDPGGLKKIVPVAIKQALKHSSDRKWKFNGSLVMKRALSDTVGAVANQSGSVTIFFAANVRKDLFTMYAKKVSPNACFDTHALLKGTIAFDIGNIEGGSGVLSTYKNAVAGRFVLSSNYALKVPEMSRERYAPLLGDEILWNDGKGSSNVPKNAPSIHVFAIRGEARNGKSSPNTFTGNMFNVVSIGMIIRFNNFTFFTGGDLPYKGENLLGAEVVANNTKPWSDQFVPSHICSFKCSHHGSEESTQSTFTSTIKPIAAVISCGEDNEFDHPRQEVIDVLHGTTGFESCFMTACSFPRKHVPDLSDDQLNISGNKFFVAGNTTTFGHIVVTVNEKQSLSTKKPNQKLKFGEEYHTFSVSYYDKDYNTNGGDRTAPFNHSLK